MMPLTSFRKSEIRKWFPMRVERLICQVPPRFNRSTMFLAKERLRVCDYVASKFSRKQRKIFIPAYPSNPSWNPEFRDRWDSYEQSLLSLPREKLANTELSPWAAIGIGISVFASLFISGILLDNNPRPIRPFNSSLLLDSIRYEPSFEWNFIDTSELMRLPDKDSFFSELSPPPPLPEYSPVEWPEPLDSITYERLGQLQDLIDSFRAINDSLSSNIPQDTAILGSDRLTIPDSAQGQAPTSQSTP